MSSCLVASQVDAQEFPDIRSVEADLVVPELTNATGAGLRTKRTVLAKGNSIYHTLYLPTDWRADARWPVIVELTGNGGFRNQFGDECSGKPEDAVMGYGISGGERFIWISLPYLNGAGDRLATTWWGDAPTYDAAATLKYMEAAIDDTCAQFGGDPSRIVLAGFSRGAIACNHLGLNNDAIAKRWKAFIAFSHYDGVRRWPMPDSDAVSAAERLKRLGDRRQFVCGELNQVLETERYLKPLVNAANVTFVSTGFRNHSDRWLLRPSAARTQLRNWLRQAIE